MKTITTNESEKLKAVFSALYDSWKETTDLEYIYGNNGERFLPEEIEEIIALISCENSKG